MHSSRKTILVIKSMFTSNDILVNLGIVAMGILFLMAGFLMFTFFLAAITVFIIFASIFFLYIIIDDYFASQKTTDQSKT